MAVVFVTRLIPIVSFDAVSYAAGLTPLTWWRFALATLGGIVPASFLLAHFGQELMTVGSAPVGTLLLALGLTVLAPLVLHSSVLIAVTDQPRLRLERSIKKFPGSSSRARTPTFHVFHRWAVSHWESEQY